MLTIRALRLCIVALVLCSFSACGADPTGPGAPGLRDSGLKDSGLTDAGLFNRKRPPRPGEWLHRRAEDGQPFDEYVKSNPVRADRHRNTLAFVPVGEVSAGERTLIDEAVRFAGLWYRLPTRTLAGESLPPTAFYSRMRIRPHGGPGLQYRTDWFLRELLPPLLPDDAVCLLGVTLSDLYPDDDWNYVFGMATFYQRVGVYSFARFRAAFWGETETAGTRRRALLRGLKLVTHELGHCFGLEHCIEYECNMNGSNSLPETDRQPLLLCPGCLRKLAWNRGFDVRERYLDLLAFYDGAGLVSEGEWVRRRLGLRPRLNPAFPDDAESPLPR